MPPRICRNIGRCGRARDNKVRMRAALPLRSVSPHTGRHPALSALTIRERDDRFDAGNHGGRLMTHSFPIELDDELIKDFLGEYDDAENELNSLVLAIEAAPDSPEHIHALFRTVHSIKGNLRMMGLDSLSELVHYFEDLLDDIRQGSRSYDKRLSDVLLLLVERVRQFAQLAFSRQPFDAEVEQLNGTLQRLAMAETSASDAAIRTILKLLDPDGNHDQDPIGKTPDLRVAEVPPEGDALFFQRLIEQVESGVPHWQGRSARILEQCLKMNEAAGERVDTEQLRVAVYLHDIGMSFFPTDIVRKPSELDEQETRVMRNHTRLGYEWLRRIPGWEAAADMVLQHHERPDGQGYPDALGVGEICDGAKIIAIADAYDAMISWRPHRDHKRTELRAVLEINGGSGSQFDAYWVEHFNHVARSRRTSS